MDAFGLKKGMNVRATKIVEVPETLVASQKSVTGTMPAPPQAPPADVSILIAEKKPAAAPPAPAAAPATSAPAKLPKTSSDLPLIGILGRKNYSPTAAEMSEQPSNSSFTLRVSVHLRRPPHKTLFAHSAANGRRKVSNGSHDVGTEAV